MRTLVIETATAACSVALIEGDRLVARDHAVVGRGHAERVVPMIGALPQGGRADAILVDCGPGSFTGVRVGLAAARGLGIGWGVPVHGYSSLALVAAAALVGSDDAALVAMLDGGHGEIFARTYDRDLRPLDAMASYPPADAIARFSGRRMVGQGTARLAAVDPLIAIDPRLPDAGDAVLLPPTARSLPPAPLYGRAPDAVPSIRA